MARQVLSFFILPRSFSCVLMCRLKGPGNRIRTAHIFLAFSPPAEHSGSLSADSWETPGALGGLLADRIAIIPLAIRPYFRPGRHCGGARCRNSPRHPSAKNSWADQEACIQLAICPPKIEVRPEIQISRNRGYTLLGVYPRENLRPEKRPYPCTDLACVNQFFICHGNFTVQMATTFEKLPSARSNFVGG